MIEILFFVGATCLIFGVIYPAAMVAIYPVYRFLGGRDSFREYIKHL
ncbi:MAG: hypothetical protein IJX67_10925 [Oscillospiraceae bacterium]|nr:hypothetical protein [Oscillospiraceae bacterium]